MAILVFTATPQALLNKINDAIAQGHIETWQLDEDGDFTHTPASGQFNGRAWLHANVTSGCLAFNTLRPKNAHITTALYGIYHGRFTEMLLNHFDAEFSNLTITALASLEDAV